MRAGTIAAAVLAVAIGGAAQAADNVKIGVIYPLTGNAASAGQSAKDAVNLAAEIVNTAHPELKNLPLGATAGLPNLGGAKIELDEADHQGNPQVGQQQTVRLITQDHVAAMLGSYHSSVSLVATAVAERQGVPYLVADSVAANITGRGFKWTFRTTPFAPDFAKAYADFLNELKKSGKKIDSIAIVNENTDYGTSVSASVIEAAKTANIKVAAQIAYNANSSDVSAQVLQLKSLQPDVVIFISYTQDIILYFKTMKNLDYLPPMIIGDDAGFSDPSFIPERRRSRPGRGQPQRLRYRQAGRQQLHRRPDVQGQIRPRSRRHQRALGARLPRPRRRHQPRRLDRARQDPGGAQSDRSETRSADDRLQRRQIRRHRPEYFGLHLPDPAQGQGICLGLAGGSRDQQARMADEGLALTQKIIRH